MPSRNVHLVGSVPLANAHDVFVTVSAALGPRLLRIPDGETGERIDWIAHLEPLFANHPALEKSDEVFRLHATAPGRTRYRLKPGASEAGVTFGNLFYADVAIRSYQDFASLKAKGKIPAHCRFQVDLVPAHSVIWLFLQDNLHRVFDPIYNDAVRREIDKLAEAIPHDGACDPVRCRLRRVCAAAAERAQRLRPKQGAKCSTRLARSSASLPITSRAISSCCFTFATAIPTIATWSSRSTWAIWSILRTSLAGGIRRSIELIHMPVPRDRSDDAYFAPLTRLKLKPGTQLCLGLVHYTDGIAGTRRRLATAEKYVKNFSIATECGFGRRPRDTISELLAIHAAAAD